MLRRLQEEYGERLRIVRRAFPLSLKPRDESGPRGPAIAARWQAMVGLPGAEQLNAGLMALRRFPRPASMPAMIALKAAEHQGAEVFDRYYERLQEAYFCDARDIGDPAVLEELAQGLVPDILRFRRELEGGGLEGEVMADYQVARLLGVRGTPSVIPGSRDRVLYLLGYLIPLEAYRAAVDSLLAEEPGAAAGSRQPAREQA